MLEFFLGLLFILLTILFVIRLFISVKHRGIYLALAFASFLAGVLIFAFTDWQLPNKDPYEANKPPAQSDAEDPQNGNEPPDDSEEPEEPGKTDEKDPSSDKPDAKEPKKPDQKEEPKKPEPNEPGEPQKEKIIVPDDEIVYYTVVKGDTLFNISQRSGISIAKIKQWNQISGDAIYIGQKLKLYGKNKEPSPNTPEPQDPGSYAPSKMIVRGNTNAKKIALTFDAGSDIRGIEILNVLKKHNVKATFFLTGKWVEMYPSYAKRIVSEGHEIANHSYSHPDAKTTYSKVFLEDIRKAEEAIIRVTGVSPRPYFRFPYGSYNKAALETVGKAGYPYSIHWSNDTLDWQQPEAEVITQRIVDRAKNGDIVLMHIGGINTPDGVDKAIPELKKKGFEIVTLTEVLK